MAKDKRLTTDPKLIHNRLVKQITSLVIVGTLTFISGLFIGRGVNPIQIPKPQVAQNQNQPTFLNQTATITGTITQVSGSTLTLKTAADQTNNFPVSDKVVVNKPNKDKTASASSGIKSIDTGKAALLILEMKQGNYQVVSISYIPS
ncbi:hypothetical protein HY389_01990 [Candidatus Daviesbacteria bacterium]|nr:hypothetical protein [Candidatus Daviesbacteria bacterium]